MEPWQTLPDPDRPWQPSAQLQTKLLAGFFGVMAASSLSVAASVFSLVQAKEQGLTLAMGLGFASILPQFFVVLAFLGLAHETDSNGLKRSTIGVFGVGWLGHLAALADDTILTPEGVMAVLLVALVCLIVLIVYCFWSVIKGVGSGLVVVLVGARLVFRFLGRNGVAVKPVDLNLQLTIVCAALAVLVFVILYLWFCISLIKLRDRLGGIAAVTGWGYMLGGAGILATAGWLIVETMDAANQPGALDLQIEDLVGSQLGVITAFAIGVELLGGALTALLFLLVRQRGSTGEQEDAMLRDT